MAALTCKKSFSAVNALTRRTIHMTALANKSMNDPLDHATGLEKQEMLAHAAGNDDPFLMKPIKRQLGGASNATLIPSYFKERIIGCICNEEDSTISWMWLSQGETKRCECGFHFKLIPRVDPVY